MKRETVNGILNAYIKDHLSPKSTERDMVSKEYETLCSIVGSTCIQSGSYARYTSTTPVNDLDAIWRIPESFLDPDVVRKVIAGFDPGDFDSSAVVQKLAEMVRDGYSKLGRQVRVVAQSHSVGIYFGTDDEFSIDLVPAVASGRQNEYGHDIYWVPEIAKLSKSQRTKRYALGGRIDWLLSDPRGYIEDARRLNDANESFRKVAKFARKWRRGCKQENDEFPLKSFHLELVVNDLFKNSISMNTIDAIEAFFSKLPDYLGTPRFADRADASRYVDEYVRNLSRDERADITARVRAAASAVKAMLDNSTTEDGVRKAIRRLLAGSMAAVVTSASVAAATTGYTPAPSFRPQRSYGSSNID